MTRYRQLIYLFILIVFLFCWLTPEAFAQSAAPEKVEKDVATPIPPGADPVAVLQEHIQMLRVWKLTQALNLTSDKASMLFPILNKYDQERLGLIRRQQLLIVKIKQSISSPDQLPEEELIKLCNELEEIFNELDSIREQENKNVREILNVKEYARFLVFSDNFPREMVRIIQRQRLVPSPKQVVPVTNEEGR